MIIWGSKTREIVQGSGQFHCPQCNGQQECHFVRIATYSTLYFIPLFETQYHGDGIKCLTCQLLFSANAPTHNPGSPKGRKKRGRNRRKRQNSDDYGV
jgi:hypothetical protein